MAAAAGGGPKATWLVKDFYAVLGVDVEADAAKVRQAYRQAVRDTHPDTSPAAGANPDGQERFRSVVEAWEVLGHPERRALYDGLQAAMSRPPGRRDSTRPPAGHGHRPAPAAAPQEAAGRAGTPRTPGPAPVLLRPRPGADQTTAVHLGLIESLTGAEVFVPVPAGCACPSCGGTGSRSRTGPKACRACASAQQNQAAGAGEAEARPAGCRRCGQSGVLLPDPCRDCSGCGRTTQSREVSVRLPAGVLDRAVVKLPGLGDAGVAGGPAGDMVVTVRVDPHPVFGRDGDHVTLTVPVSVTEAALGADVSIPTPGGDRVVVRMRAGTQPGTLLRLRGRGAGVAPDLVVHVKVLIPEALSPAARQALQDLAATTETDRVRDRLFRAC